MTRASPARRQKRLEPTGKSAPVAIGQRYNEEMGLWDLVVVIGGFADETAAREYGERTFSKRLPA